jgi:hypothetical protein
MENENAARIAEALDALGMTEEELVAFVDKRPRRSVLRLEREWDGYSKTRLATTWPQGAFDVLCKHLRATYNVRCHRIYRYCEGTRFVGIAFPTESGEGMCD